MKVDAKKLDAQGQQQDVRRLREFSAFERFSDSELMRLVQAAHHASQSVPWPLIREQTPSEDCFILLKGEVGVYVGQDRVALLGPGEVIGESAIRRGKLRSATVTTIGPAEFLRIERDDFARLLDEIPALRETMEATAARHASSDVAPKAKPARSKVNAAVPATLVERFEEAATAAGVSAASALEDALTSWIERNATA